MQRPVWLFSMDSDEFHAPPTTTAALSAYYRRYGERSAQTNIDLVHFQSADEIATWLAQWRETGLPQATAALAAGQRPIAGFSFYTWNAAEFLELTRALRALLPELLVIAGGPHVQQAEDYLGTDPIDVVFLGEAEVTFQEFLDCDGPDDWRDIDGLAFLDGEAIFRTAERERCADLDRFPSPLEVLQLTGDDGEPLYESIAYETSRGCPFKCAFCEWGTGAIGSRMYQWSMPRIREDWERIVAAGIKDIWLADSNFGALKQDLDKAELLVELKENTGLPVSFATSWSKKHSRQVQQIALLLHQHRLLPHYQLALQTLTPEALRLSNRQNMSSNEYRPIAKQMAEEGVPIAAELIWGLPGTEFYERRDEYRIEAIPVAGYGKAKGEYVVGCHSFSRDEGEEGYFLISAHILLVHGHIMPLTTRFLALGGTVPVSPLFRDILRAMLSLLAPRLGDLDTDDRMAIYESRDRLFLEALTQPDALYDCIESVLVARHHELGLDPRDALRILALDNALCPRTGGETTLACDFDFDARAAHDALAAMELPALPDCAAGDWQVVVQHPGGVGDILLVADGGSWLRGVITDEQGTSVRPANKAGIDYVAIA